MEPVWLKLHGEEKCLIPERFAHQETLARKIRSWARLASQPDKETFFRESLPQLIDEDNMRQEEVQACQGGDKHRLTEIYTFFVSNWWDPDQDPEDGLLRAVLVVKSQTPCRLEWINDEGCWTRDHVVIDSSGDIVQRRQGESARGALGPWLELRRW